MNSYVKPLDLKFWKKRRQIDDIDWRLWNRPIRSKGESSFLWSTLRADAKYRWCWWNPWSSICHDRFQCKQTRLSLLSSIEYFHRWLKLFTLPILYFSSPPNEHCKSNSTNSVSVNQHGEVFVVTTKNLYLSSFWNWYLTWNYIIILIIPRNNF